MDLLLRYLYFSPNLSIKMNQNYLLNIIQANQSSPLNTN